MDKFHEKPHKLHGGRWIEMKAGWMLTGNRKPSEGYTKEGL